METNDNKNIMMFIKELAKYYMEFLETDFHKRKNPKRSIKYHSNNNLLIGLNLNKYPSFNNIIWKAINKGFDKNTSITIKKGVYKTNIPKNLLDFIKVQIEKLSGSQINKVLEQAEKEIRHLAAIYEKEYDLALMTTFESVEKIIKSELVLPLINTLEKPLENLTIGDKNNIYLMEEELTSILCLLLENKISEILNKLLLKEDVNITKQLSDVFEIQDIKSIITTFFENVEVGDLFAEIYEMERNRSILDKQEFYLYFFDISFEKNKYPIFYIPIAIERQGDLITIEFDAQVYINKKAIEYIAQEYNERSNKKGKLKKITERIIYLAEIQNNFREFVNEILSEIINYFELDRVFDLNNSELQVSKSNWVKASNSTYIALFDKSDEALVNDYEEILKALSSGNNVLSIAFNKMIDDFIHKDPKSFNMTIADEWDKKNKRDRLVFSSPIPLNGEQLQILSAVNKDGCRYIIVEGPPGTGKSHTITAIVFESILNDRSVLVLSDKKEALDVVEDKITDTMNKVRLDKNFQNPILRLGRTGNTYSQILATSTIENIKTHFRAVKKNYDILESNIEKLKNTLKEDLEAEILAYEEINFNEIKEFLNLETYLKGNVIPVDIKELLNRQDSAIELEEFRKIFLLLKNKLVIDINNGAKDETNPLKLLNFNINKFKDISDFQKYLSLLNLLYHAIAKLKEAYGDQLTLILNFETFSDKNLEILNKFINEYEKEKNWLFGYLFKKARINELNFEFRKTFNSAFNNKPHKNLKKLKNIFEIFSFANELKNKFDEEYVIDFDYLNFVHKAIKDEKVLILLNDLQKFDDDLKYLKTHLGNYPNTIKKLNIDLLSFKTFCDNELVKISDNDFDRLIRYITLYQKIEKDFNNIPMLNYTEQIKYIEDLITAKTTFILDGRLISFYENNKATARALRDIIRSKRRFPKDEFQKLKNAFPCILAGIRDYAEYIPLEPEIFDLVIIDEASQVSIAQAFPALIRAKKVLILGDKKQFSNVKTAQARTDINKEWLNHLSDCFKKYISNEPIKLKKLEKFNIKTSILEFFEFINNYSTQLLKHFRGYKEIISYSNKYFYGERLQVMKIRGKPIDEVLKFSFINNIVKNEKIPNTNTAEADFIISELKKLKNANSSHTVGIITPHTNQQKLLVERISRLPEKDYFYENLKLKIMTFDTCQGEERDIIFYSMVATEDDDRLWGVFIKNIEDVDKEEEGYIKVQRLNVGFSRAKECMHFVLSKPLEKYSGSIGEALRYYKSVLEEAKKERSISEVDQRSAMEPKVMNWFYQTEFWKKNSENITFIPQFEIGKYLKQLDITYNHPNYKVDFLLIYKDKNNYEHKIIIEYDGFEHFKEIDFINEFNYQYYMNEDDIYRQRVLESYGYKFLRINRFNIGDNPIKTLNDRIESLIKVHVYKNDLINNIHQTIEGLQNGDMRECPKCKEIRNIEDFKDPTLITGYGRFCKFCKDNIILCLIEKVEYTNTTKSNGRKCPKCGSKMVLRRGRYGKFYGCSKFPFCRETIKY